jgi:CRISPR-associated protein Cmr5
MSDAPARRSLEQRRAQAAWETVQKVDQNKGKEFKSVATSLPADIQANGFGQTMAFLRAKGKDEHNITFDAVADWVRQRLNIANEDFMSWLMTKATTEQYRRGVSRL